MERRKKDGKKVIERKLTIDKSLYDKYILWYMKNRKVSKFSTAILLMAKEIYEMENKA